MTPEIIIPALVTVLASIFVGSITFFLTKGSESKKLEEVKEDAKKELASYRIMEAETNAKLTKMLEELTKEVVSIKIGMAELAMQAKSYELIWKKFGEHDEKFSGVGSRLSVVESICERCKISETQNSSESRR